jgi:hypothetical protein
VPRLRRAPRTRFGVRSASRGRRRPARAGHAGRPSRPSSAAPGPRPSSRPRPECSPPAAAAKPTRSMRTRSPWLCSRLMLADAVAALDRPQPIRIPAARLEHGGVPGLVGAVSTHRQHPAAVVDHLDRGRTLVWIHSDDPAHPGTSRSVVRSVRRGQRYFERNKPPSSLSSRGARRDRKPGESHTRGTDGQPPNESVSPSTWTESGQTPVLQEVSSSRRWCR